jgi:CDP-glucose 4,6-dehydratase
MCKKWGQGASYEIDKGEHPHKARYLKLDCSKAKAELGWAPRWSLEKAIDTIIEWTKSYNKNKDLREACLEQIGEYERDDPELQHESGFAGSILNSHTKGVSNRL